MILFGFEVDTLEIALREQLTLVDKVFIVESTLTHKGVSFISLIPFTLNVAENCQALVPSPVPLDPNLNQDQS